MENAALKHWNDVVVLAQDPLVLQNPDLQRSWIKKLSCFTVLKPTERSFFLNFSPDTQEHLLPSLNSLGNVLSCWFEMSGMATYCAAGLLVMSRNIWRRSLNRRSWQASHTSCAGSQVSPSGDRPVPPCLCQVFRGWLCFCVQGILSSLQRESFAVSGFMTPGLWAPTPTLQKAVQCRTWKTWWSPFLGTNHRHKYQHLHITK